MRILTFTTLYPNTIHPSHGIFVENRLRHLVREESVTARVVAPVPWFPFRSKVFGRYGELAQVPEEEERFGVRILHPRYPLIPKLGMSTAPFLMYQVLAPMIGRCIRSGYDFDLLDAHYFYPDGVAAVMIGKRFSKPVVITARGTDINLIPEHAVPRRLIRWAAKEASGLIAVCQALKDRMTMLGMDPSKTWVLRNGVDLDTFQPKERGPVRSRLGLTGKVLLSVGHLIPRKRNDLVLRALPHIPDAVLLIVGDGPCERELKALADSLGVQERVRFLGRIPQAELPWIYSVADALILASDREGWPNVLLEAMACGTPVVATSVWGVPEVVASDAAGVLVDDPSPEAIAGAARRLLSGPVDRGKTRAYAEAFSWDDTTQGQLSLFERVMAERSSK